MKRIFTTILLTSVTLLSFAQSRSIVFLDHQNDQLRKINTASAYAAKQKLQNSRSVGSEWVCYIDQVNNINGGTLNDDALMHLFPDSTIILGFSQGAPFYTWLHAGGTMIDPLNMPDQWLAGGASYVLDSIAAIYAYTRHTAPNIVDTLHVDLIKSIDGQLYTLSPGNEEYQDILWDTVNYKVRTSNVITSWDILLSESDSTTETTAGVGLKTLQFPASYSNFGYGDRIGAIFTFKPGYTWTMQDSIWGKNAFLLLSSEENGDNTDPNYFLDHNCSYTLPNDVRYNISTTGWDGFFLPTWAWQTGWDFESHYIFFKLTSDNVGVNNLGDNSNSMNVYPNPASDNVAMKFNLKENSNVVVRLSDVDGKEVASFDLGKLNSGNHNSAIDVSTLSNGVYMLSMETSNGKSIQKITVIH